MYRVALDVVGVISIKHPIPAWVVRVYRPSLVWDNHIHVHQDHSHPLGWGGGGGGRGVLSLADEPVNGGGGQPTYDGNLCVYHRIGIIGTGAYYPDSSRHQCHFFRN